MRHRVLQLARLGRHHVHLECHARLVVIKGEGRAARLGRRSIALVRGVLAIALTMDVTPIRLGSMSAFVRLKCA